MVPSAVNDAMAWSTALRTNGSFDRSAAPISAVDTGSGVGRDQPQLGTPARAPAAPTARAAQTSAAPAVPRNTERSAASSVPLEAGSSAGSAAGLQILDQTKVRRASRWIALIACDRGMSASDFQSDGYRQR